MKTLPEFSYVDLDVATTIAERDIESAHFAANILNVDMWGDVEDEELHDTDIDDCIEAWLEECEPLPEYITVCGYRRRTLEANEPSLDPEMILERILEDLDDEYGGGDETTEPTPRMIEFARALASAIRSEYEVWQCEPVHLVKVHVESWLRAHREDAIITEADLEPPTGS